MPKVVFCTPMVKEPMQGWVDSLSLSVPAIEDAGWDHGLSQNIGNPYISCSRADMLRKALDAEADVIVFIDYDVSWRPEDMVKLLSTEGDVVAGTYRFKDDTEEYMGWLEVHDKRPIVRADGCVKADTVPAGFLKITREAVKKFMRGYPELVYGDPIAPHVDIFNHGARGGVWWGEDYSFSDRWKSLGGEIWIIPDMNIDHHTSDKVYKGNLYEYLLRLPNGSKGEKR